MSVVVNVDAVPLLYPGTKVLRGNFAFSADEDSGRATPKQAKKKG